MRGWGFVVSWRWLGYFLLVVAFAAASCGFGNWQFDRRDEARAANHLVESNYDRTPVPITQALDGLDVFGEQQKWTPVVTEGTYLHDEELLVRNRPFRGHPGFEVLTPLLLDDGTVLVINRGWVPIGELQDDPDVVPPAPEGRVTVVSRLKPGEPTLPGRTAGEGQIATIHLDDVAERLGLPTYTGAYGAVAEQTPEPAETPITPPKPDLDEGPHLSYALQWYVFAVLAFIGLGWALRHEYRLVNSEDERVQASERRRREREVRRAPSDAEIEDALLDDALI